MKRKIIIIAVLAAILFIMLAPVRSNYAAQAGYAQQHSSAILLATNVNPGNACSSQLSGYTAQLPAWYCPINQQVYDAWSNSAPIAMIAVLFSFGIAALIFMVGVLARSNRIREFGIGEFYEAIASAIIVILFIFVSGVLFGLVPEFVVGPINPYATAFNLILQTIGQARQMYDSLYQVYVIDDFYQSISVDLQFPISGFSTNLFRPIYATGLDLLVLQPTEALTSFLVDGMIMLYSEYYLLMFFAVASIPAFLVPGVIFRAIFPTRALGGMLIAVAMAFYLVVPTLFAVAFYFVVPNTLQQLATVSSLLNRFGANGGSITNAVTPDSPIVLQLNAAGAAMGGFWLMVLFFPVLIIAFTYVFITQMANFIGGASRTSSKFRSFL